MNLFSQLKLTNPSKKAVRYFPPTFQGMMEAHSYWLIMTNSFDKEAPELKKKLAEETGEFMVTINEVIEHNKIDKEQTRKLLDFFDYWLKFLDSRDMMGYVI